MAGVQVDVALKDIKPIADLVNAYADLIQEIETNNYTKENGVKLTDTKQYKHTVSVIHHLKDGDK